VTKIPVMKRDIMTFLIHTRGGSFPRNRWFESPEMQVYLRGHNLGNVWTVDVANITVREELRGQGIFSKFLSWLEKTAVQLGYSRVKIENILNKELEQSCILFSYKKTGREYPFTFIKELGENK
jgi:GNAT superfamily N-acetyltransferase